MEKGKSVSMKDGKIEFHDKEHEEMKRKAKKMMMDEKEMRSMMEKGMKKKM